MSEPEPEAAEGWKKATSEGVGGFILPDPEAPFSQSACLVAIKHELACARRSEGHMVGTRMLVTENNPKDAAIQQINLWCDECSRCDDSKENKYAAECRALMIKEDAVEILAASMAMVDQGGTIKDGTGQENLEHIRLHALAALSNLMKDGDARRALLRAKGLKHLVTLLSVDNQEVVCAGLTCLETAFSAEVQEMREAQAKPLHTKGYVDFHKDIDLENKDIAPKIVDAIKNHLLNDAETRRLRFAVVEGAKDVGIFTSRVLDTQVINKKIKLVLEPGDKIQVTDNHLTEDGRFLVKFKNGKQGGHGDLKLSSKKKGWVHCSTQGRDGAANEEFLKHWIDPKKKEKRAYVLSKKVQRLAVNLACSLVHCESARFRMKERGAEKAIIALLMTVDLEMREIVDRLLTEDFGRNVADDRLTFVDERLMAEKSKGKKDSTREPEPEAGSSCAEALHVEGWMDKKVGIRKEWRRVWCELSNGPEEGNEGDGQAQLSYMRNRDPTDDKAKKESLKMGEVEEVTSKMKEDDVTNIDVKTKSTYMFLCKDADESKEWVKALEKVHQNVLKEKKAEETVVAQCKIEKKVGMSGHWREHWCQLIERKTGKVTQTKLLLIKGCEESPVDVTTMKTEVYKNATSCKRAEKKTDILEFMVGAGKVLQLKFKTVELSEKWLEAANDLLGKIKEQRSKS